MRGTWESYIRASSLYDENTCKKPVKNGGQGRGVVICETTALEHILVSHNRFVFYLSLVGAQSFV